MTEGFLKIREIKYSGSLEAPPWSLPHWGKC